MLPPLVLLLAATALALATVEGLAYWWMHPAQATTNGPVLVWSDGAQSHAPENLSNQPESRPKDLQSFSYTDLPELYARTAPALRCTGGWMKVAKADPSQSVHLGFFEWDRTEDASVIEAFKHLPEECMGSIGMTLVKYHPSRSYQVGTETLSFGHIVFLDPSGALVHSFKATWVAGSRMLLGSGMRGGGEEWRQLRMMAALKRFRPTHARVVQGAVRGITDPDEAWQAFENAMLCNLQLEKIALP